MAGFDFQQAVEVILLRVGVEAGNHYEWQLQTRAGALEIQVHDTWLQTRFSNPHEAALLVRQGEVDPHTGRWDWHFETPNMDDVHAIERALAGLLDAEKEQQSDSVEKLWKRLIQDFLAKSRAKGTKVSLKMPAASNEFIVTFPMGILPTLGQSSTTQSKGKPAAHSPKVPLALDYPYMHPIMISGAKPPPLPLVPKRPPDLEDIAFEILRQARYKQR